MADPTVADVFNQLVLVNGKLDNIDTNTFGLANSIVTLDSDVNKGFKNTVDTLKLIAQIDIEAVKLLYHLTQQANTMICVLEHISQNTCGILTQATIQTPLQQKMKEDLDGLLDIGEAANPAATLSRHKLEELQKEIERCCPPPTSDPACTYKPCPAPKTADRPNLPELPNDPKQGDQPR